MRSSFYHFFKTKNTPRAQLVRIVFAVAVSIWDLQSLIAHINHNPDEFSSGFFVLKKMRSSFYHFFKTKNTPRAQLVRIVFAVAVSIGDLQSLIAHQSKSY
jgi:uncharacterized protein YozE (UPF0346 family)